MKKSFYFALWLVTYIVIGLIDKPYLNRVSFVVACIVVWMCSACANRIFRESIACRKYNEAVLRCEQIYTKDKVGYLRDRRYDIIEGVIILSYFALTIIGLFTLHSKDFFCYGVFFYVAIATLVRLMENVEAYNYAAEIYDDSDFVTYDRIPSCYAEYCQRRCQQASVFDMLADYRSRSYQTTSYIASGVAVWAGLVLLLVAANAMSSHGADASLISSLMYGSLAFVYGIKDLVDENKRKRFLEQARREASAACVQEGVRTNEGRTIRRFLKLLFSFKGRTGRKAYIISTVVVYIMYFISEMYVVTDADALFWLCFYVFYALVWWTNIAIGCKRCHDIGHSGWFQLIPFWGIALFFIRGDIFRNKYDRREDTQETLEVLGYDLNEDPEEARNDYADRNK